MEPLCETIDWLKAIQEFRKKTPSLMFGRVLNGTKYSRMDQVKFVEDNI